MEITSKGCEEGGANLTSHGLRPLLLAWLGRDTWCHDARDEVFLRIFLAQTLEVQSHQTGARAPRANTSYADSGYQRNYQETLAGKLPRRPRICPVHPAAAVQAEV